MAEARETAAPVEVSLREHFTFDDTPRLTASLRAGNEEAYRWLHARWNARLFRYCFALAAGDGALADELTQATYLRLLRHVRVLPDETALWNWMARAARSAATDLRRTGGRYRHLLQKFLAWTPPPTEPSPLVDGERGESATLLAGLDAALARLDLKERSLIEQRYFQGRSLADIARQDEATVRAVEGRLARLRRKLRKLMAEELKRDCQA